MFKKIIFGKPLKIIVSAITVFSVIAFANREYDNELCNDVVITIHNQHDNYYMDDHDLMNIINGSTEGVLIGKPFNSINLKEIENRIIESPFIRNAQVYKDLKGNLVANATLRRPVARIIRPDKPDAYISEEGILLPVSEKFNSRVVLISGKGTDAIINAEQSILVSNPALFDLIEYVNEDEFWKAQIAQIDIDTHGEVTLYPQVTKQYIEFGQITDVDNKFKKLRIFYKRVLPLKGWNYYDKVNLKYKGQIIAE